ncbi:hypothetical protein F4861DRAFT_380054 [Xylaria intraflava]|nr:hypothetical protein F4861DRAFT_380054 [Xylaria intraflava]
MAAQVILSIRSVILILIFHRLILIPFPIHNPPIHTSHYSDRYYSGPPQPSPFPVAHLSSTIGCSTSIYLLTLFSLDGAFAREQFFASSSRQFKQ